MDGCVLCIVKVHGGVHRFRAQVPTAWQTLRIDPADVQAWCLLAWQSGSLVLQELVAQELGSIALAASLVAVTSYHTLVSAVRVCGGHCARFCKLVMGIMNTANAGCSAQ